MMRLLIAGWKRETMPADRRGEVHGPFKSEDGCVVLEISYPSQVDKSIE